LSTNLRLLLDEAITNDLADDIRKSSSAINVEYVRDLSIKGSSDEVVMAYAKGANRIVVTTETGINHKTFPICTHPGIIVLSGRRRHESFHTDIFRKFLLSGHRKDAREAVTYISKNAIRVKSHTEDTTSQLG
jgi:predicted nuclease of predicted toxin-antitoxin system